MKKIHHATAKKAKSKKIDIRGNGSTFVFASKDGVCRAVSRDPKAGLELAIKNAEEGIVYGEAGAENDVVGQNYRDEYSVNNDRCGDSLSVALTKATVQIANGSASREVLNSKALIAVGRENKINIVDRWGHLVDRNGATNWGMIRMNFGNVLRGKIRKGEKVTISGRSVATLG